MDEELDPDIRLALAALASELGVHVDQLPGGFVGILRAFSAARYGEGARDFLVGQARKSTTLPGFPKPKMYRRRNDEVTPVYRRVRSAIEVDATDDEDER